MISEYIYMLKNAKTFHELDKIANDYIDYLSKHQKELCNYEELIIEEFKIFHEMADKLKNMK